MQKAARGICWLPPYSSSWHILPGYILFLLAPSAFPVSILDILDSTVQYILYCTVQYILYYTIYCLDYTLLYTAYIILYCTLYIFHSIMTPICVLISDDWFCFVPSIMQDQRPVQAGLHKTGRLAVLVDTLYCIFLTTLTVICHAYVFLSVHDGEFELGTHFCHPGITVFDDLKNVKF